MAAGTKLVAQSASARGAEPQVFAATAPGVEGGEYFGPKALSRGYPVPAKVSERAHSLPDAERLW